jgi:hypothetical protein
MFEVRIFLKSESSIPGINKEKKEKNEKSPSLFGEEVFQGAFLLSGTFRGFEVFLRHNFSESPCRRLLAKSSREKLFRKVRRFCGRSIPGARFTAGIPYRQTMEESRGERKTGSCAIICYCRVFFFVQCSCGKT